jgi:hypothetical protein
MQRSESAENVLSDESTRGGTKYDWVTPMAPRRVTVDENPSYGDLKPSLWTPEETRESPIDKTPNQLQSPEFQVQSIEIRELKERLDRQDDILETMLREMMSLRREMSLFRSKNDKQDVEDRRKSEDLLHSSLNHAEIHLSHEQTLNDFNIGTRKKYCPAVSSGTQFVAEFSQLFELEHGQHTLLASILDRSVQRRNQFKHN